MQAVFPYKKESDDSFVVWKEKQMLETSIDLYKSYRDEVYDDDEMFSERDKLL